MTAEREFKRLLTTFACVFAVTSAMASNDVPSPSAELRHHLSLKAETVPYRFVFEKPAFLGEFNHRRGKYTCPYISQTLHFTEYTDPGVRPDQNIIPFKRTTREARGLLHL